MFPRIKTDFTLAKYEMFSVITYDGYFVLSLPLVMASRYWKVLAKLKRYFIFVDFENSF